MAGQGDYQLCGPYAKMQIPIEVWASQPKAKRDNHVKKFQKKKWLLNSRTIFTTDGRRSFVGPGTNGGKKPHQRKRKRNAKTTTLTKKRAIL